MIVVSARRVERNYTCLTASLWWIESYMHTHTHTLTLLEKLRIYMLLTVNL